MNQQALNSLSARADFRAIARWVEPRATVLDLGCGDGSLLSLLMEELDGNGKLHGIRRRRRSVAVPALPVRLKAVIVRKVELRVVAIQHAGQIRTPAQCEHDCARNRRFPSEMHHLAPVFALSVLTDMMRIRRTRVCGELWSGGFIGSP